jgi:hypothetical protein
MNNITAKMSTVEVPLSLKVLAIALKLDSNPSLVGFLNVALIVLCNKYQTTYCHLSAVTG